MNIVRYWDNVLKGEELPVLILIEHNPTFIPTVGQEFNLMKDGMCIFYGTIRDSHLSYDVVTKTYTHDLYIR